MVSLRLSVMKTSHNMMLREDFMCVRAHFIIQEVNVQIYSLMKTNQTK